jgi:hypothetical protein
MTEPVNVPGQRTSDIDVALAELRDGPLYRFADWPNPAVANGMIGAYTVWQAEQLVYAGMAGRDLSPGTDISEAASGKPTGIRGRLASHASGRRAGDQFCVYVFDRLVLPALSRQQIEGAARGQLSLDRLTRELIRQSLSYRFTLLPDAATAWEVETKIQREGITSQLPLLNPRRGPGVTGGLGQDASSRRAANALITCSASRGGTELPSWAWTEARLPTKSCSSGYVKSRFISPTRSRRLFQWNGPT